MDSVKYTEYVMIRAFSIKRLNRLVGNMVLDGYIPLGSPVIKYFNVYQAMVRK